MDPLLELLLKLVGYAGMALFGWVAYRQHRGKMEARSQLEEAATRRLTAQREDTQQHLVSLLSSDTLDRLKRAEARADMQEGALGQARSEVARLQGELITSTRELASIQRHAVEQAREIESLRRLAGDLQRQNLDQQTTIERLERELGEERTSVAGLLGEMVTLRRSMEGTHSAGLAVPALPYLDAALERMKTNPPPPPG